MNDGFRLFPESASSVSDRVDQLFMFLCWVAVFFSALICVLILFFGVRYRRGSKAARGTQPLSGWLEVVWIAIPLLLTMVMFAWGAALYYEEQRMPANAIKIDVVAKQWMWKLYHADGHSEINELHVPVNQPVLLQMVSEDVIHSFFVPAFRVKQDVLPGRYTDLWFQPTKTGVFHLFCAEYCGTEHSGMRGSIVVMEPAEYSNWLSGDRGLPAAAVGESLFARYRCNTCHRSDGTGNGPRLEGLFNQKVALADGSTVTADDQYLRDSILDPAKQVVAGYQPLMPSFKGQLAEGQVLKLIAYLESLSATNATRAPETK